MLDEPLFGLDGIYVNLVCDEPCGVLGAQERGGDDALDAFILEAAPGFFCLRDAFFGEVDIREAADAVAAFIGVSPWRVTYSFILQLPLRFFRDAVKQLFGVFPTEAGVCDGFTVDHLRANLLRALEEVAFNHDALDELVYGGVVRTAVQHLADDADLLFELFAGIRVVDIHDAGGIFEPAFFVEGSETF